MSEGPIQVQVSRDPTAEKPVRLLIPADDEGQLVVDMSWKVACGVGDALVDLVKGSPWSPDFEDVNEHGD